MDGSWFDVEWKLDKAVSILRRLGRPVYCGNPQVLPVEPQVLQASPYELLICDAPAFREWAKDASVIQKGSGPFPECKLQVTGIRRLAHCLGRTHVP